MRKLSNAIKGFIISFAMFVALFFSGCTKHHYHYVHSEYPDMPRIEKVIEVDNATVQGGCLYLDNESTNLCGNDLKVVLTQIKKLRINEDTYDKLLNNYNEFVAEQLATRKKEEVEYSFGF